MSKHPKQILSFSRQAFIRHLRRTELTKFGTARYEFVLRSHVLKLYRDFMRNVRKIPDPEHRQQMLTWIRDDFKKNKHVEDEETIKMMLTKGKMSLSEFKQMIELAQ